MDVPGNYWIWVFLVLGCLVMSECRAVRHGQAANLPDEEIDNIANSQNQHDRRDSKGPIVGEEIGPKPIYEFHPDEEESNGPHKIRVHKVHHEPGHTQQEKVEAVQKFAESENVTGKVNPHPTPAPQRHEAHIHPIQNAASMADVYFLVVVAACSVAGLVGLVVAGVCWYRLQKNVKAASEAEYPAYGVTGPTKERVGSPGDRKLAQSAQMYHYQHQKQQMIALERANGEMKHDGSDEDSEEENEEGDYTVYECPGLAPTGEMEVKNPLFSEDTPVTPTPGGEAEGSQK